MKSLLVLGCALWLTACQQAEGPEDHVLAKLGDDTVTSAQLLRFEEGLPAHLRSEEGDIDARREHLQSLIDRMLLRREAEGRQLDTLESVRRNLAKMVARRLREEVVRDHVNNKVVYSEEELREAYDTHDLGWQVWPAHILSANEEDARGVIAALEAGRDFFELARERSLADDAKRGGDLGKFFTKADAIPVLREGTFHLEKGAVSEPLKTKDGYEVIKILDKRRLDFGAMRQDIQKRMHQRKWAELHADKIAEFESRWGVRFHGTAVRWVMADKVESQQEALPLFSYEGGAYSVGECRYRFDGIRAKGGAPPADSLGIFEHLQKHVLPDTLWNLLARAEGRDQTPAYGRWYEARREEVMLKYLYTADISTRVSVDLQEARDYYQEHLETYRQLPGVIELTEVLLETRAEAEEVLTQAQNGADLRQLAVERSLRPGMEPVRGHTLGDSGRVGISSRVVSPYREILGPANTADVGKIQGPTVIQDRFSVFRLDAPIEKTLIPFSQYRKPITATLRQGKEAGVFTAYIDSLRRAAADRLVVYEDRLASLQTAGDAP